MNKKILVNLGCAALVLCIGYNAYHTYDLYKTLENTDQEFTSTTVTMGGEIAKLNADNLVITNFLTDARKKDLELQRQDQMAQFQIATLTKLTTLDPDLLKKYSKVYFLNENYVPSALAAINPAYLVSSTTPIRILDKVDPFLEHMLADANTAGVPLRVISGYRSFADQMALKTEYRMIYGAGTANQFSADQGYSEHQLGTALDFTTPTIKGAYPGFDGTDAYAWLGDNAYKYGFILSYPKANTYYEYEPWHWRFVGITLATYLHNNGQYFYQMDQRDIDAYLLQIFDQ